MSFIVSFVAHCVHSLPGCFIYCVVYLSTWWSFLASCVSVVNFCLLLRLLHCCSVSSCVCVCVFFFFFCSCLCNWCLVISPCGPFVSRFFTFFLPLRSSLGLFVVASLWWVVEFESLTCANKLSYEVKDEQRICHNPSGSWCSSIIMWPWDKHQRHFQTNVSLKIQSLYYLFSLILLLLLELTSVCHCFNHTETSAAAVAYSHSANFSSFIITWFHTCCVSLWSN